MKKVKVVALSLLSLISILAVKIYMRLKRSMPVTDGELELPGLSTPVEVTYDTAGIPHVKAENDEDGLKALGYVVAQDRLLQMEILKRTASGTLGELISLMAIDIDRFMRTVGLSRLAREFSDNLSDESRKFVQAFVDGVNAYVSQDKDKLPFEYMLLGGKPQMWNVEDVFTVGILLIWMLESTWMADLLREKLIRKLGSKLAMKLLPQVFEICDPACKTGGEGCGAETIEPGPEIDWDFDSEGGGGTWLKNRGCSADLGSNNWVVHGSKTDTGKPILCNDPHIQHMVPSTLYISHLKTPSFNMIGAGFVGLPVVAMGHNEHCAWGATTFYADTMDLYVETFESADSDRYLFEGKWVEPEITVEEVRLRFLGTRKLRVVKTAHGPVIKRKGNKGLALKWTGMNTSLNLFQPFLTMNSASNWHEFREALRDYLGPGLNFVCADTEGNIGYQGASKVPIRARGDGTIPYHGENGDSEWLGYIPFDEMPTATNPPEGMLATANNKAVTEDYEHLITKCWEEPFRQARIIQLLKSKEKLSVEDMKEFQSDIFTLPGQQYSEMVAKAASGKELEPAMAEAVRRLADWDHRARANSVAMTIYYFGWHHMTELLLRHRLGDSLYKDYIQCWINGKVAVEQLVREGDRSWLPPGCDDYDELILQSLKSGMDEIARTLKTDDQSAWEWGEIHTLTAFHMLGLFWPLTKILNVGPVPRDGDADTVNSSFSESDPVTLLVARGSFGGASKLAILPDEKSHKAYAGPLFRFIADLSDWDNCKAVLDIGQCGHRLSPHYKDHFEKWLNLEYFPLPFSDEKVEECKESKLRLIPS